MSVPPADFATDDLKVKATERYSFGWSNARAIGGGNLLVDKFGEQWYAQYVVERVCAREERDAKDRHK